MEKTILHIEDNFHNRDIVRRMLEGQGYTVIEAEDGVIGLEMVQKQKPPLVLLDINLPRLDGISVIKRIRADPSLQNIPVIAVTASAMVGDRERFLEAGCNDYLPKPVRLTALIRMVDAHYPWQLVEGCA